MNVYVYQTSGGKDITQPLLPETKAIVLLILEQLQKDGFEFLYTKPVLKNSKPKKIKEIKRNNVRLLYFVADNTTYITNIISNKQKNKLERQDKSVMLLRPLTCHIPVSPGLVARRARWWSSYLSHSSTVGGRVPTKDISPPYVNSGTTFFQKYLIKYSIINLPSK